MADDKHLRNLDTPWHIGFPKKHEDDPRRHKSRCRNYIYPEKGCKLGYHHCKGSAHCSGYKPYTDAEYQEELSRRRKLDAEERKHGGRRRNTVHFHTPDKPKKSYVVGGRYSSKQYGQGVITWVKGNEITVRFEKGPIVKFDAKTGQVLNPGKPLVSQAQPKAPLKPSNSSGKSNKSVLNTTVAKNNSVVGKNQPNIKLIETVRHILYGKGKVLDRYKNEKGQTVVTIQFTEKTAMKRDFIWEQEKGCFL